MSRIFKNISYSLARQATVLLNVAMKLVKLCISTPSLTA